MPFKSGSNSADTSYNGVNCYGGVDNNEQSYKSVKENNVNQAENVPSGMNKYGATEDLGEQGEAALKHGTTKIPGLS